MSIPASNIVQVNPGVVGTGGNPLSLNGLIVTESTTLQNNSVMGFTSRTAIKDYFGAASPEYAISDKYFLGYLNSTVKPEKLWFAKRSPLASFAYLRSASLAGMTLAQLQDLGVITLVITVDGDEFTFEADMSDATSFSNAAALLLAGTKQPSPPAISWESSLSAFLIASNTTGPTSTITYGTGTAATDLKFTQALGAQIQQGSAAQTLTEVMDGVILQTQNWASFTTMEEPDTDGKIELAEWSNAQNQRYLYVAWDTDAQAIVQGSQTNFGYLANATEYNGVMPVYNTLDLAVFILGGVASINFNQPEGRRNAAFMRQSGFTATVTDKTTGDVLLENGYSFYGEYATANDLFNFLYDGHVSGQWKWMDSYVNQIQLNSQFQLALMDLLTSVGSIPYNEDGYSQIRAAMADPIQSALSFGTIRTGVALSESQKSQVNQAAGRDISRMLEQQGYYLQVLDPGAQVRGLRGSPIVNFWYMDGGSVQKISLSSIAVL